MSRSRAATLAVATATMLGGAIGCEGPDRPVLAPIPIGQAIRVVNHNGNRVTTCLKAEGQTSGHFTDEAGRRRAVDLRAVLHVIAPRHLYLTLKSGLGTEEMLAGSNEEQYWLHVRRDDDTYRYGTHAAGSPGVDTPLPLRPDLLIEALGLNSLPADTTGPEGPVQRIVADHQQLIFLTYAADGQGLIRKEYWLDRREPRLIRRIIFRDAMGQVVMDSRLSDHAHLSGESDAPLLPGRVRVEWPLDGGLLDLRIRRWTPNDRRTDHPAFIAPHDRGLTYTHMIDLDTLSGGP
ncbi:MAG: hypothetical protein GY778_06270 [bacterium]|nr:hypothetical protein [bacterium]